MTPLPIEDYALIGDCETAALVGRDGSIDWLCLPRFDSPACFAALLGTEANGRWRLAPASAATRVRRAYRDDTLVLETEFETETGVAFSYYMHKHGQKLQADFRQVEDEASGTTDDEFRLQFQIVF